jgi:hypothetical protein
MRKQDKHNHHKLPRHFLNGFAAESTYTYQKSKDIWVYRKGEPFANGINPSLQPISETAASTDFYAYERKDGSTEFNHYEDLLNSDFEKPGEPILEKIRRFEPLDMKEQIVFSRYVGSMVTRGDWWRGISEKALEESTAGLKESLIEEIGEDSKEKLTTLLYEQVQSLRRGELFNQNIIRVAKNAAIIFNKMTWRFLTPPVGMYFLTCDKPVSYFFLDRPESELIFPLSSKVTLSLSWQPTLPFVRQKQWKQMHSNFWEVDQPTAVHIRSIICAAAIAEVYGPKKSQWLPQFINNRPSLESLTPRN